MSINERLSELFFVISEEAERNSRFRRKLELALSISEFSTLDRTAARRSGVKADVSDGVVKRGGRRAPAVVDPMALARQGEVALKLALEPLTVDQLKDIVAEFGMDPGKLVMKWKDRERISERIFDLSMSRSTKGDAFRR